jgi:hypothetical protein
VGKSAKPVERRLIRMLVEAEDFKKELAQRLQQQRLYQGLETEKIFAALIVAGLSEQPMQPTEIAAPLEERDRRMFFEILFEEAQEGTWEEAESCMEALRGRQIDQELAQLQREIENSPSDSAMRELLARKQDLMRRRTAGQQS